jgi:hypothetical protein
MHSAEASVATDRAERYLDQLCSHLGQMQHMRHLPKGGHGGAGAPRVEHVERSPGRAEIRFADGSWTLQAAVDALVLRVEADDPASLERLKDAITARITKIGRRDGLAVTWHAIDDHDAHDRSGGTHGERSGRGTGTRRWWRVGWFAVIAAAVAIHLGLLRPLLGAGRFKDAAADAVFALLAVKLAVVALHTRFGRGPSNPG